jgi:hypothetical protein
MVAASRTWDADGLMSVRVVLLLGLLAAQFAGGDAAAQDDRQKLIEENLSLKIRNTALEADVLTLQDRLNRVAAERDRALTDGERIQAELADIRTKASEAAARLAELERQLEAARAAIQSGDQALRESVAREQDAARRLAEQLARAEAKAEDQAAAPMPTPKPDAPSPAQPTPNAALQEFTNALTAVVASFRSGKPATASKARLLRTVGMTLSEVELEQILAGLVDKKSIASWTKYGNETVGLSYLLVTKVADNRFVGVVNLSFEKLLNDQSGVLAEIEAIDKFFPVEIRSHDNWDETRVSWLYEDGDFLGALPHVPPLRTPWTIADYLKVRGPSGQAAAAVLASGGRRDAARPITLSDLEKKSPEQFLRLAAASDAAGYPKIYATMYMNSVILDPAVLTRGLDFQDFPELRESMELALSASLGRTPRDKGVAAPLYGRLAALILMPDFAIQTVLAQGDGARLAASYTDAAGIRQAASVDFRRDAAGARWLPAAIQR